MSFVDEGASTVDLSSVPQIKELSIVVNCHETGDKANNLLNKNKQIGIMENTTTNTDLTITELLIKAAKVKEESNKLDEQIEDAQVELNKINKEIDSIEDPIIEKRTKIESYISTQQLENEKKVSILNELNSTLVEKYEYLDFINNAQDLLDEFLNSINNPLKEVKEHLEEVFDNSPSEEYDPETDSRLDEVNEFLTEHFGISLVEDQLTNNQVETIKSQLNELIEKNYTRGADLYNKFLTICDGVLTEAQKAEINNSSFEVELTTRSEGEKFKVNRRLGKLLSDEVKDYLKKTELPISFITKLNSLSDHEQYLRITWNYYFDGATYFMERLGSSNKITGETNSMIQRVASEKEKYSIIDFVLENFSSYIYPNYIEEMNAVKTRILSEEIPF
ncbi:MAG: hypothetical protein HC930_04140 [Hydrococcus sp. SU_1_0]|nr:hypothetical protein [Hydrococcus sp. SU_1_0]